MPNPTDDLDLERDIFGGSDSDLSSEDEARVVSPRPRRSSPTKSTPPARHAESDGDDEEYKLEPRRLPTFKKKNSQREERGESSARPTPREKRRRRSVPQATEEGPQEEVVPLTAEEQRRLELNQQIDAIIKPSKSRGKKRKKGDEEDLDAVADHEVDRIRRAMIIAHQDDQAANERGRPATAKLKLLPEVMKVLQKSSYSQSVIDQNLLECVKRWLEPLPDKSLPALNIQKSLFEALAKIDMETATLKESELGPIVLFYTKPNKRVTAPIKRQADTLIAAWSRPILKRPSSYQHRVLPTASLSTTRRPEKLSAILAKGKEEEAGRVRKNAVRIPERNHGTFTIAPASTAGAGAGAGGQSLMAEIEKRRLQQERFRKMQRKLDINRQKMARM